MTNLMFVLGMGLLIGFVYIYTNKKVTKRENEFNDFAYKMQKDFLENSPSVHTGVKYYKTVENSFTNRGFTLSKHPDYPTDFIAKNDQELIFIRIQSPQDKKSITAEVLQNFIGQTILPMLNKKTDNISWSYVCSKMMCDRSAKILISAYESKLKFELIEAVQTK